MIFVKFYTEKFEIAVFNTAEFTKFPELSTISKARRCILKLSKFEFSCMYIIRNIKMIITVTVVDPHMLVTVSQVTVLSLRYAAAFMQLDV